MTDNDARRRRYVPVDVLVAFTPFGSKLHARWGMEGLCTWMLFLAAAKREPNQGTFTYTSEPEAWTKLGATATLFGFDEFVTFCGRNKQTRRTRSGRVSYVQISGWKLWNKGWKNQQDSERNPRSEALSDAEKPLTHGEDTASEVEVEYEVEGEVTPIAPPAAARKPRERDHTWEALLEACGIDGATLTKTGRGAANKALHELKDVGAVPADIRGRAVEFKRRYPQISLTPSALAKHWGSLRPAGELSKAEKYAHLMEVPAA